MKKFLWIIICLAALLAAGSALGVEAVLPPGYEEGTDARAVIYLMPEEPGKAVHSGLTELLRAEMEQNDVLPMILVPVEVAAGQDPMAALRETVAATDAEYRTVPDAAHRAALGIGAGGYLAYQALLEEDPVISAAASIRGRFAGEDHPWLSFGGDLKMKMLEIRNRDSGFYDRVYTYMDAPVEDEWTDEPGSTDDLGAMMISWGTGRASHEFTVRPGVWDESFLRESVHRVADRFSRWMEKKTETEIAPAESIAAEDSAPTLAEDRQILPLDGAWHFHYTGTRQPLDAAVLTPADWEKWDLVRPGVGNWTKGYGNISEKNVLSSFGPDYFDYSIVGNGYYARTFTLPEGFETKGAVLSLGSIDDRCQVYVNGTLAGSTGMTEAGQPTQESTWAEYSAFPVPSGLLRSEGENTLVVRAWNDLPYGAGGWYAGPVGLYSAGAFQALMAERNNPRFREETFPSAFAAHALGQAGTVDQPYLVYLPEGYEDSTERYPSVYLLHQFNSDHTSYRMDHVDRLLDEGIAQGLYGKMIVIIPKSSEESWWTGDWERMVTEELVPYVDSNYRTVPDAGSRLTAGCSMGGQGSFGIALRHPELFSGAISFFGAFSYGGASSPNAIAASKDAAYMRQFALYFICGNQDSYGFGVPAIQLHQKLREMGVEHRFFIENGGHDSSFYLPYFQDAFKYIWQKMGR